MIKISRISVRPNTNTPFYIAEKSFTDYFNDTYIETGVLTESVISPDDLTKIVELYYSSEEVKNTVNNDPNVRNFVTLLNEYNSENRIIVSIQTEEIQET